MISVLKIWKRQGTQYIPDVIEAKVKPKFRGLPILDDKKCSKCADCVNVCESNAIHIYPLQIDMGKCTFCGNCMNKCSNTAIDFTNFHKLSSTDREKLLIDSDTTPENYEQKAIVARKEIIDMFGKSLKLRSVSAGGCNACELELNACSNVNFDMGRFGIEIVASPRHADGIIITGPISEQMSAALEDTYKCVPEPKIIILAGACAISGGVFAESPEIKRKFLNNYKVDLFIPGCPVHPLTIINGILKFS